MKGDPPKAGLQAALLVAASSNERETDLSRTIWLIEYNFNRPHQCFDYPAPEYILKKNLLKSAARCYLCGQPAQKLNKDKKVL